MHAVGVTFKREMLDPRFGTVMLMTSRFIFVCSGQSVPQVLVAQFYRREGCPVRDGAGRVLSPAPGVRAQKCPLRTPGKLLKILTPGSFLPTPEIPKNLGLGIA